MITAILNGYRRAANLDRQIEALERQTIRPTEILIWHNHPGEGHAFNLGVSQHSKSAYCTVNLGVWARFAYALNARTEFIGMFDDDTIPGPRWFENCQSIMNRQEALLGAVGLLYENPPPANSADVSYDNKFTRYGWADVNNEQAIEVDLVGHAWFFRRSWLSTFWRELPDPDHQLCGEDMHFSFMLQKYLGIPTIVPPHPPGQRGLWGSTEGTLGIDTHSLWLTNVPDASGTAFRQALDHVFIVQRKKGWRLVNDR
jgi:hypothetical protein